MGDPIAERGIIATPAKRITIYDALAPSWPKSEGTNTGTGEGALWTWHGQDGDVVKVNAGTSTSDLTGFTEAKIVNQGKWVIACTAWDVAVIRVTDKKLLFQRRMAEEDRNLHSVELLPNRRLAAVSPNSGAIVVVPMVPNADDIVVRPTGGPEDLYFGHALLWDTVGDALWVAGRSTPAYGNTADAGCYRITRYAYDRESGKITPDHHIDHPAQSFPFGGGWDASHYHESPHDLIPVPGERAVLLASDYGIYRIDIDAEKPTYTPIQLLGDEWPEDEHKYREFKAISQKDANGFIAYYRDVPYVGTPGYPPYGRTVRFFQLTADLAKLVGAHPTHGTEDLYRARWCQPVPEWPTASPGED